ncbi:MAG TPA: efflux RND transporter periplasmic adaptor subunit [Candidatus Limnocylindria bacterium]|nr:efflux RND transporter periplasmic adaptor subunit [Candidatus Limnocylindria bacterium]
MKTASLACSILLFVTFAIVGCRKPPASTPEEDSDPKVEGDRIVFPTNSPQLAMLVVEAAKPSESVAVQLNGRLVWDEGVTVRVFSAFAGRVSRILVEPGATVPKGAPLVEVASPDFGQAQSEARKVATDLAIAEKNLTRLRELASRGAAATKDIVSAEADLARAQAEQLRATRRLEIYDASAETINNNYVLKSPIGGVVVELNANPGQEVRADQILAGTEKLAAPLFTITDPTRLWIQVDATESDLAHLRPGQMVSVRSAAIPSKAFPAKIELIGDSLDPVARTVKIRASVQNPDRLLKSEMLASVEAGGTGGPSVEVSAKAVFFRSDRHYLFIESERGRFQRREVQIGYSQAGKIQVVAGIKTGDRVVGDGAMLLQQVLDSAPDETPPPANSSSTGSTNTVR